MENRASARRKKGDVLEVKSPTVSVKMNGDGDRKTEHPRLETRSERKAIEEEKKKGDVLGKKGS